MSFVRYVLISVTCLLLVNRSKSFLWKDIENAWNVIKKPACKVAFGIACPIGVMAAETAIKAKNPGAGVAASVGAAVGTEACSVAKDDLCKRNLDGKTVFVPFPDKFNDYDKDSDGFITFKEFLEAVMSTVNLSDPEDLIQPFSDSDKNGDKQLNQEEFANSDFLFPDENERRIMESENSADVLTVLRQLQNLELEPKESE